MNQFNNEIPKHKKKSKKSPPKKHKHKHEYLDCVFESNNPYGKIDKAHGFKKVREVRGGSYCKICGKINLRKGSFDWFDYNKEHPKYPGAWWCENTERAKLELDPKTRTLPTFFLDDHYAWRGYVNLSEKEIKKE